MITKFIIMCGGKHPEFSTPKPLLKVNGVSLAMRTVNILREFGFSDISISTSYDDNNFDNLGVNVLKKENTYSPDEVDPNMIKGYGVEAFYPVEEPVCYLCGDVGYSRDALRTIVDTEVKDFIMFGTQQPLPDECPKGDEPMGFKVVDNKMLEKYCNIFKKMEDDKQFKRKPISGELYRLIEGFDPNVHKLGKRFIGIHDFASDIDHESDIKLLEEAIKEGGGD